MTTKSQELRQLMQVNASLVRLEEHVVAAGLDVGRDLETAFDAVGISTRLVVPELTSVFSGPQGPVLHIPVLISKRDGGRKSLFALAPGQELVAGIYVIGGKHFERRVLKRNGGDVLRVGDSFTERITDIAGTDVQTHAYEVSAIGVKTGAIYLESATADGGIDTGDLVNTGDGWCWFCNMGTSWWCGFPCLPGDFGDIFV